MDALARLEVVARDLMRQVDAALVTLGAPADHPVWGLLRRLRTTPADAVAFFVGIDASGLRDAAATLRDQAEGYEAMPIPVDVPWRGAAGESYAAHGTDLDNHLTGPLAHRLRGSAACADEVADWCRRSRDRLARALATVLTSAEAVTVRSGPPTGVVVAAADIGAHVLAAVDEAVAAGRALHDRWQPNLSEAVFHRSADPGPARLDATIDVHRA
jgi:hypothetical protein